MHVSMQRPVNLERCPQELSTWFFETESLINSELADLAWPAD